MNLQTCITNKMYTTVSNVGLVANEMVVKDWREQKGLTVLPTVKLRSFFVI